MTVSVSLRASQPTPLTWPQVDANFTALANAINVPTFAGGSTASRPTTPALYQVYFDTTLGLALTCSNISPVTWVNAAGVAS